MTHRFRLRLRSIQIGVATIACVLAIGVAISRLEEAELEKKCHSNLRMLGLAILGYENQKGVLPPGTAPQSNLAPDRRLSWIVLITPFIEQLFYLLDYSKSWDDPVNMTTRVRGVDGPDWVLRQHSGLICPAAPQLKLEPMPGLTSYVGITGLGPDSATLPIGHPRAGVFGLERQARPQDITDGVSNTMMVAETTQTAPWTAGGRHTLRAVDPAQKPYLGPGRPFGGFHRNQTLVLMVDGSVRHVSNQTDPKVFEDLSTIAGNEPN